MDYMNGMLGTCTSGVVVVRHAERGEGREALARALQRGEPPVSPERGAAQHEVAEEYVDRKHLLNLHVFDPGHLQEQCARRVRNTIVAQH